MEEKSNFIKEYVFDKRKFITEHPLFLESFMNKENKDRVLDPDKNVSDINPPSNLELLA